MGGGELVAFVALLVGSILILVLALLALAFGWVRRLRSRRTRDVLERFAGRRVLGVEASANFFGQASSGPLQIRGNGVLVLTDRELYFEMWLPARVVRIPVASILSVETARAHLGKTRGTLLLKVVFRNERGEQDSAAWLLKDVHGFKGKLEALLR